MGYGNRKNFMPFQFNHLSKSSELSKITYLSLKKTNRRSSEIGIIDNDTLASSKYAIPFGSSRTLGYKHIPHLHSFMTQTFRYFSNQYEQVKSQSEVYLRPKHLRWRISGTYFFNSSKLNALFADS